MPKPAGRGFLASAEIVLRKAGKPLNCSEIVARATRDGLLETSGRTPQNTLHALLTRHISAEGSKCKFRRLEGGLFDLRR